MMPFRLSSTYLKLSNFSPKYFQAKLIQTCFRNWRHSSRNKPVNIARPLKTGCLVSLTSNLGCKSPPKLRSLSISMTGQGQVTLSRIRATISKEARFLTKESSSRGRTAVPVASLTPILSIRWVIRLCLSSTFRCTIRCSPIRTNTIWARVSEGCSSSTTRSKLLFNSSLTRCNKIRTCK